MIGEHMEDEMEIKDGKILLDGPRYNPSQGTKKTETSYQVPF